MGAFSLQGDWPLVGRAEELAELVEVVASGMAARDRPAGAVVVAPAGVGKTRLLREVGRSAEQLGAPTVMAIATRSASHIPYAAVAHLAPQLPTSGDTDRVAWFNQFARELHTAQGPRPVLLVDDAQWLDPGSAALVLHLALTGVATVVVTLRRGEAVPDPVTALWKDGLALRIDVQPFAHREIEALIDTVLVGEVSRWTTHRLAEVSQGNILFARELVIGAVDVGSLRRHDGIWRWDEEVVLAPRLVDAVGHRLEGLDEGHREALALLAVGEPLLLQMAERAVDPRAIARLESAGLVRVEGVGVEAECRLTHPLYGEVLLRQVGRVERRRLTRALADLWETSADRSPHATVQVAAWRLETGGTSSPELLTEAAVLAGRAFDHVLAERLAKAALEAGAGPRAVLELAMAHHGQNRIEEAERILDEAEPEILRVDEIGLHQVYLERRDRVLYRSLGRRDAMFAVLARFRDAHDDDSSGHAAQALELADAYEAKLLLDDGRLAEVLALTDPVLTDPGAGEVPVARALEVTGEALVYRGRTQSARGVIARMRHLAVTGPTEVGALGAHAALQEIMCLVHEGRLSEALAALHEMHDRTLGSHDLYVRTLVAHVLGAAHLQQGTARTARTFLLDAVAGYRQHDVSGSMAWALAMACQADALLGDESSARERWQEALAARPACRVARMEGDFVTAEAMVQMAAGNVTGAARTALEGATRLEGMETPCAQLMHLAVRLGAPPASALDDLTAIAVGAESGLPALMVDHVRGLAEGDGGGLEAVSERFDELGLWLCAAESAAQAARLQADAGRRSASARSARRSRELADRCEGARTPALRLTTPRQRLSPRETEVARLAARGLSNADIANRLVLSVRTVESHLYSAFAKAGVEQREELADALDS